MKNPMLLRVALLALLLIPLPAVAADEFERLREWFHYTLSKEIDKENPNLNLFASFSLPLANDALQNRNPISLELARQMRHQVVSIDRTSMSCGELADLFLISGFLSRIGEGFEIDGVRERVKACIKTESSFDLANTLIFFCGHAKLDHQSAVPGGLERLMKAQQPDGSFVIEDGSPHYYLTSHALLAMHYCKGDPAAIAKTQQLLTRLLPDFQKIEFLDGLAESLIFLRWSGAAVANEKILTIWMKTKIRPDGGVCFRNKPGCEPHWHPASLMMELLLEQQPGELGLPGDNGFHQGAAAFTGLDIDIGTVINQELCYLKLVLTQCNDQGSGAVVLPGVHVLALLQQGLESGQIALVHGANQLQCLIVFCLAQAG